LLFTLYTKSGDYNQNRQLLDYSSPLHAFLRGWSEDLDGAVHAAGDQSAAAALPGHAGHSLAVRAGQVLYDGRTTRMSKTCFKYAADSGGGHVPRSRTTPSPRGRSDRRHRSLRCRPQPGRRRWDRRPHRPQAPLPYLFVNARNGERFRAQTGQ
jgi:hypothetical protein